MPPALAAGPPTRDLFGAPPPRNRVAHVVRSTNEVRTVEGDFESPYLAGFRGDNLGDFNAFAGSMMLMVDCEVFREFDIDIGRRLGDRTYGQFYLWNRVK